MQTYRSLHPNHAHQLTVCASKHYWFTRDGVMKYQHKNIEVSLNNLDDSKKTHLVHFIIRDHYSGVVYSEVGTSKNLPSLDEFLYRAWSKKDGYIFCGIPELLTIPATVERVYPEIKDKVAQLGVQFPKVTSGFQSGMRDVRTLEEFMKFFVEQPYEKNRENLNKVYHYISAMDSRTGAQSKLELWRERIQGITVPPASWLKAA